MTTTMTTTPVIEPAEVVRSLLADARRLTFALFDDLSDEQMLVPMLPIVNPILWEMGHAAYFAEFWTLRNLYKRPPIIANADQLYDSARIPHDDRWSLPLPSRLETRRFLARQLDDMLELLPDSGELPYATYYFHRLAVHHEDMHDEAFIYTRQTLGYPQPTFGRPVGASPTATSDGAGAGAWPGDVDVPAGRYVIGSVPGDGFVFDNEKWAHEVELGGFQIAKAPVSNVEFAAFIADGGYRRRELWSDAGWAWREGAGAEHPIYWSKDRAAAGGVDGWQRRHFDRVVAVAPHRPVINVNWFEAEAYCRWAKRRLPSEAEWEVAATGGARQRYPWGESAPSAELANLDAAIGDCADVAAFAAGDSPFGCRQMIGNVWEWTASAFAPYPGFMPDSYKEYSEPWFYTHNVVRGGAWSTRSRLITSRWRNFYMPHRRDILIGFRTCALD